MKQFELSTKKYKNGRRPFKAILYELQPPECVIDDIGTKYNENGITFLEEYAKKTLDSIENMSVRVEFIDEDRILIGGHGETGIEDGIPVFKNATTIGHCTKGYITDIEDNGEVKRCVCAEGYLDEMCYPDFIASLDADLNNGIDVKGSIEIFKTENNDAIIYKKGWLPKGRIPTEYIHSGWDMVTNPADPTSTLLELNNNKQEETNMESNNLEEIKSIIKSTITELNTNDDSHKKEVDGLNGQITELNVQIENKNNEISEKEQKISELNASVAQLETALSQLQKEQETWWQERAILEQELAKAKVAERLSELDNMLDEFNEAEQEVAKDDIEKLRANINACTKREELNNVSSEINSIKAKICMSIVEAQKSTSQKQHISEQNSHIRQPIDDIFSEMYVNEPAAKDSDDFSMF